MQRPIDDGSNDSALGEVFLAAGSCLLLLTCFVLGALQVSAIA